MKIKGGVSYYLINKQFEGKTLFNNSLIDINKYDILVEPKYYDFLTKFINIPSVPSVFLDRLYFIFILNKIFHIIYNKYG